MTRSTSTSAIAAERREPTLGAEGVLVVVGGNRGIGAEVARRAARAGMPVAIVYYSRAAEAERTVADIEAEGGRARAFQADIGVEAETERAFAEIEQHFGRLRGLVQCAVMAGAPGRLAELAGSELERVFRSNVFGAFYCCREASRRMSRANGQHGGAIVLFSSVVAVTTGAPGTWLHFAASKGALEVFSARPGQGAGSRGGPREPRALRHDRHRNAPHAERGVPAKVAGADSTRPHGRTG